MNALKRVLSRSTYRGTFQLITFVGLHQINPLISKDVTTPHITPEGRYIDRLNTPIEITLVGKEELATDTFVYRFALPDETRTLGHETC